jgi:hypothetical protein
MSLRLADILYRVYFLERNIKLLIDYNIEWPNLRFAGHTVAELLMIWVLSKKLNVTSPIPKIPFVDPGAPSNSEGPFGWEGSKGFIEASHLSRELKSVAPKIIEAEAVAQVICEIEEAFSDSNTLIQSISRIERCCPSFPSLSVQSSLSSSSSSCRPSSSSAASTLSSLEEKNTLADVLTSPHPSRKNPSNGAKTRNKDHSNKGSVGSHKLNYNKVNLSLTVR